MAVKHLAEKGFICSWARQYRDTGWASPAKLQFGELNSVLEGGGGGPSKPEWARGARLQ